MSAYRTESCVLKHPEELGQAWLDLQDRADCSYFLSWGWIGTWLRQIAIKLRPVVVRVWYGEELVGLAVFVPRNIKRRIAFRASALFLHEYPFDRNNMVIEYNGLLAARGHESAVYAEIVGHLLRDFKQYDEFHFGAITETAARTLEKVVAGKLKFRINEESVTWQADLRGLEAVSDSYLMTLSSNARGQIRRALRLYEQREPLQVFEAVGVNQTLEYFARLKALHAAYWQARGQRGAFANPCWETFHRDLIQSRFDKGEVQMLKVANAGEELGYIYNHLWNKRVYMQQTGFSLPVDNRLKPGYVAHVLAVQHNRDGGMHVYDFMHGDARYKRTLSNRSENIYWVVVQRGRIKFTLENLLLGVVRRGRRLMGAGQE
ncbi:MAG: GNAT family N-acetyltransferase [Gammaproteobacteria bacterium]